LNNILRTAACLALGLAGCARYPEGSLLDGVRPGADGRIHVIAVFAHPDDESFYTGGTLIKLRKDPRVRLHLLCLTNGNRDEAKDTLGISGEMLGRLRVKELESAALVLGADTVACPGYDDQGLAGADHALLLGLVQDAVRKAGAHVIITHDPYGLSGHEDHIVCSRVATEAFGATDAQRLYYVTMTPARYRFNLLFALSDSPAEKSVPTMRVDVRAEKTMKRLALYAHVTQHHFSFWNALAMREDMLFDYEHFTLAGAKDGGI
jgi:N-acetylglucosamine malate deacetylase 2